MVGLVTFQSQYNCGSALQAYALQETIKLLGFDCKILNYFYWNDMKAYDLVRWCSKNPKVILFDFYTIKNCYNRKRAYKKFQNKYLNLTEQTDEWQDLGEFSNDCEILVCGSDQIWNPGTTQGVHPAYFLEFANAAQRRIAYGPSFAISSIPTVYFDDLRAALQDFSAISVREKQTADQLATIIGRKVFCALDPTLLHNSDFYDRLLKEYTLSLPQRYLFVYCLHYTHLNDLRKSAEKYAKKHNLKIVYFNKFNIYHPLYKFNIFQYGPEAFLYAIKHADFVMGDSFHAAVFSVIYNKQFSIYAVEGGQSRTDTLFERLGIEKNYLNDHSFVPIDYDKVNSLLKEQQEESLAFLKAALEGKHFE